MQTTKKRHTVKANEILSGLYQAGYNAHRNTSLSPEKRAESIVKDYTEELEEDLKALPEDEHERYGANYKSYLFAWLGAQSRCASTMITGPANFPVRQQEKAHNSERNKYNDFREWRERVFKAIEKRIEREKTPEQKSNEAWQSIQAYILDKTSCIIEIDKGINTYTSRQLIVSNLASFIKRMAKNGQAEHVKKSLELLRQINAENTKPIITEKSSIWKLEEVAEAKREQKADIQIKESQSADFVGGKIVFNYKEERIQIFHDEKPPREKIEELKSCAYRWSPFNKCWQRKLTQNAIYTTKNF